MLSLEGIVQSLVGGDALLRLGFVGVVVGVGIGDLVGPVGSMAFGSTGETVSTSGRDGSLGGKRERKDEDENASRSAFRSSSIRLEERREERTGPESTSMSGERSL